MKDDDLLAQINAAIAGDDDDAAPEPESEITKVEPASKIDAPYPSMMFSERHPELWEKGHKEHPACPDIPVPAFEPEHWSEYARPMIPSAKAFENYIPPFLPLWQFYFGMLKSATTQLVGPKGSGKSTLPEYVCAVSCIPFWTDNHHEEKTATDLFGSSGLEAVGNKGAMQTVYKPTVLTQSMMDGGQGLFLLDEANRGQLMPLQKVLEPRHMAILPDADSLPPNERILVPDPARFWIILADNTQGWGDDTGNYQAQVQDSSTNDRKRMNIHMGYMDAENEAAIIKKHAPTLHNQVIAAMLDIAHKIREAHDVGTLLDTASLRLLIPWAEDMATIGCPRLSFRMCYYDRQTEDDKATILEIWRQVGVFGEEI